MTKRIVIPAILAATILVAGMFALMPVDKAGTVHTGIQANTARMVSVDSALSTAADQDIRITCPATSTSGCRILELYVEETTGSGAGVRIDQIDAVINLDPIANMVDINPDLVIDGARALVGQAGGIAVGPGDTLTLVTNDGATDNAARYQFRVIVEVEGNTTVQTSFVV